MRAPALFGMGGRTDAVEPHVGDFRRPIDEELELPDRQAVAQDLQLRQQIERDEAPHLDAGPGVDSFEDAVVGADPDKTPSPFVGDGEARIRVVGRRIERGGVHDGRRRVDNRTDRQAANIGDHVGGVARIQVHQRRERCRVRGLERHHRAVRQDGVQISHARVTERDTSRCRAHARRSGPRCAGDPQAGSIG